MGEQKRGSYFGTEIDGRWYKRFLRDGMFARGNGVFWLAEQGLYFLRTLTSTPIHISWAEMTGARLGTWHSGKWGSGNPILKIDFRRHDLALCAGFLLSRDWDQMKTFVGDLVREIDSVQGP